MRGIEAKLDALAGDPANGPFVEVLRGHIRNFDFRRYLSVLEGVADD